MINTKEQSVISAIKNAFEGEDIQTQCYKYNVTNTDMQIQCFRL